MNNRMILVASLALALAGPAFAQSTYTASPTAEAPPPVQTDDQVKPATDETVTDTQTTDTADTADTAKAADTEESNDTMTTTTQSAPMNSKPAPVTRVAGAAVLAPSVAPIISASAPQPTAANHYDPRKDLRQKVYPTTDKAHTAGDPPVIDHSMDIAPVVNPTTSAVSITKPGG
jgi:hypothetical protein